MKAGTRASRKGIDPWWMALRTWLDVRMLPSQILRGHVSSSEICYNTLLGLMYFLAHWEEIFWRTDTNLWELPFNWLPESIQPWLWIPAVAIVPWTSWWLDRWIGQEARSDQEWRPMVLRARRVLCGIPILGLGVIPIWYWLNVSRPLWALRRRPEPRLELAGLDQVVVRAPTRTGLGSGLFSFSAFIFASSFLVSSMTLRAIVVALNTEPRPWVDEIVVIGAICLRLTGFVLQILYFRLWSQQHGLGTAYWVAQGLFSVVWLIPVWMSYTLSLMMIALGEKRWAEASRVLVKGRPMPDPLREVHGRKWTRWLSLGANRHRAPFEVDRQSVIRIKRFALIFEVAVIIGLLVPRDHRLSVESWSFSVKLSIFVWIAIGAAGLLLSLAHLLAALGVLLKHRTWPWSHLASSWSWLLGGLAVLVGVVLGGSLNQPVGAGVLIRNLGLLAAIISPVVFILGSFVDLANPSERLSKAAAGWLVGLFVLVVLGQTISLAPRDHLSAQLAATLLLWGTVICAPMLSHVLAWRRLPRMLWPFRSLDILCPGMAWAARWRLAVWTMATVLPLGGLVLPFIQGRRERLLQEFDRFWSSLDETPS